METWCTLRELVIVLGKFLRGDYAIIDSVLLGSNELDQRSHTALHSGPTGLDYGDAGADTTEALQEV